MEMCIALHSQRGAQCFFYSRCDGALAWPGSGDIPPWHPGTHNPGSPGCPKRFPFRAIIRTLPKLELLREAVPGVSRVAILWYPEDPGAVVWWQQAQVIAQALGITVLS